MTEISNPTLLLLSNTDNVLVTLGPISAGPNQASDGTTIGVTEALTLGHKVARATIPEGAKIIKYGVPIGSATADIAEGAHVHVHNMKSDYTATHSLEETAGGTDV